MVRYTVDRPTPKSSASSAWVSFPESCSSSRCLVWLGFNFGCLPRSRPLALATFIPSRVRSRIRSDSNSATIANTLNKSRPTGSVGSWIEPPRLSLTFLLVSSSRMSRASGSDRQPTRCGASRQPRSVPVGAGQAVIDIDAIITDTKRMQTVALGGEILLLC